MQTNTLFSGRPVRVAAWVLGFLALLMLAAWIAVPRLLRHVATSVVHERLHRELKLGSIAFNPLTLELTIQDISLPDADGSALIGVRKLVVRAELLRSIWNRGGTLSKLLIDGLSANAVISSNGHLNLADLAQLGGPEKEQKQPDNAPPRLLVDQLALTDSELHFRELDRPEPFVAHLRPIRFELHHFSTLDSHGNQYHLAARSDAGESFEWNGQIFIEPLRSHGDFKIAALRTATLAGYIGDSLPVEISSGSIDLQGDYQIAAGEGPLKVEAGLSQLDVKDLGLRPKGGSEDYVHLDLLRVGKAHADVTRRDAQIDQIEVHGGRIHAWLEPDGKVNLLALADTSPQPAPAAAATQAVEASTPAGKAAPAWQYRVPAIVLDGLNIQAEDRSVTPTAKLALHDIALKLTGFSSNPQQALGLDLSLGIDERGRFSTQGQLLLADSSYKGKVSVADLDLRPVQPYLQRSTDMTLQSALLGAQLDVQSSAKGPLTVRGDVEVRDLRSVDNFAHQDFIKWDRVEAKGIDFSSVPQRLHLRQILAQSLYARVIVGGDQTLNVTHILNPPDKLHAQPKGTVATSKGSISKPADNKPMAAKGGAAAAPMDIAIDLIRVEKASANYTDLWIKPNFQANLVDLNGSIKGLSSKQGSRAQVDIKGSVDHYAPTTISGEINPLAAAKYSDIKMTFRNMDLTTVTPYSGHFAGYTIRKGKMSADLAYKINDRKLDAEHHFIIDQLELGEHVDSPDATGLPVKLAIALLKDRNGVIDLNLPITGTLDDPTFRVGPLIWKVLVNLVEKAVTAPFKLLGSLFGGGEQLDQIDFAPGTATLDAASLGRLDALHKALAERPGLSLEVPAAWSATVDRPVLQRQQLAARLSAMPVKAGTDRYHQLLALLRSTAGADAALPPLAAAFEADKKRAKDATAPAEAGTQLEEALLTKMPVSDGDLAALGKARATAVQDVLFKDGTIDPTRVFVTNAAPASADEKDVKVNLALR